MVRLMASGAEATVAAGAVPAPAPATPAAPSECGSQQREDQEDPQDPEEDPEEPEAEAPVAVVGGIAVDDGWRAGCRGGHVLGEALAHAGVVDANPDPGQQAHHEQRGQNAECSCHEEWISFRRAPESWLVEVAPRSEIRIRRKDAQ